MSKTKATLSVFIGGILWGLISIFTTQLNSYGFSAIDICLYRAALSGLIMLGVLAFSSPQLLKIELKDVWMFIGTGMISLCLFNCCYFYAIEASQASIAVGLLYTSPVFVMMFSALLFRERITSPKLFALLFTVAGCFLISGLNSSVHGITTKVLIIGIAAGLFYGLYSIFGRFALEKYSPATVTVYTFLFASLGALAVTDLKYAVSLTAEQPISLLWCLGISIFATILPYYFYTTGLKYLETSRAAVLVTVEPLVACLVGLFLFGEPGNWEKLVGIACILVSTVVLGMSDNG